MGLKMTSFPPVIQVPTHEHHFLKQNVIRFVCCMETLSLSFIVSPQRMFTPPMPGDVMVNLYINLSKLCLTVYQLHVLQPNTTKVWRNFIYNLPE